MKLEKLAEIFDRYSEDEYLKFERVENKLSNRADLHAFLLLDKLVPGKCDIVSAAEHDEFWLDIEPSALAKVITEEQILELVRCGVRYEDEQESFAFFT